MMEARLQTLFKKEDEYKILQKFLGKTLAGKKYKPIFPYYAHVSRLVIRIGILLSNNG